ncbi:MAG: HPP family protein [Candidatus Limnocylindrales bacterium]
MQTQQQLLVADVMTIDPVVVHVDASLEEAAHLLRAYSITGLPVVDEAGDLVGVISQTDLVEAQDSPVSRLVRGQQSGLRVGELMTSPAVTVPMAGQLDEAARLMIDRRVHRLVAIDDAGHPVGVLSAMDFVALYAET